MAAQAYADALAVQLSPGPAPATLPGEGGCVLTAHPGDRGGFGTVAIRLDSEELRVAAFFVESEEMRWALDVRYDLPAPEEFNKPTDLAGER